MRDRGCSLWAATLYVRPGEECSLSSLAILRMVTSDLLDTSTLHLEVLDFFLFAVLVFSLERVLCLSISAQGATHMVLLAVTLCRGEGDHIGFGLLHSGWVHLLDSS